MGASARRAFDLDGTLPGRDASLFRDADGGSPCSARRRWRRARGRRSRSSPTPGAASRRCCTTRASSGLAATSSRRAGGLVWTASWSWLTDGLEPRDGKTIDDRSRSPGGARLFLLERYAGRLRSTRVALQNAARVSISSSATRSMAFEADELLSEEGLGSCGWSTTRSCRRRWQRPRIRTLVPARRRRLRAVARHMQARGYAARSASPSATRARTSARRGGRHWSGWSPTRSSASRGCARRWRVLRTWRVAERRHGAGV